MGKVAKAAKFAVAPFIAGGTELAKLAVEPITEPVLDAISPDIPEPAQPPPPPPEAEDVEVKKDVDTERRRLLARRGFRSTILAGGNQQNGGVQRKTLLGS